MLGRLDTITTLSCEVQRTGILPQKVKPIDQIFQLPGLGLMCKGREELDAKILPPDFPPFWRS